VWVARAESRFPSPAVPSPVLALTMWAKKSTTALRSLQTAGMDEAAAAVWKATTDDLLEAKEKHVAAVRIRATRAQHPHPYTEPQSADNYNTLTHIIRRALCRACVVCFLSPRLSSDGAASRFGASWGCLLG
jgi:hypothetical protein